MRVRFDKVRETPFRWSETKVVDAGSLGHEDLVELSPVAWEGEVRFADPDFLLRARYEYTQTVACTRCLSPVKEPVTGEIQLLLSQEAGSMPGEETELTEEDLDVLSVRGEEIDLEPLLIEQIQLNVPMKPVCRADCKGLCPDCGANWNETTCDCRRDTIDPRWQALAAFKNRSDT